MIRRAHTMKGVRGIAIALIGIFAVACGGDTREADGGDIVIQRVRDPIRVASIELGRSIGADNRVIEATEEFLINDTIFASVELIGTADEATLKARWTRASGQLVDETVRTVAPNGETVAEFHLAQPTGWARGQYRVEILLDGKRVGQKEFEVS
jgi:hypothetical protein